METPDTKAGRITEAIMREVTKAWEPQGKVPTANYNRIYSNVLRILIEERV